MSDIGAQTSGLGRRAVPSAAPLTNAAFTRKSSGLIKTGSPWRIFVYVLCTFGLGVFMSTFFFYGAGSFPRSYTILGIAIVGVAMLVFNTIYALMAGTFPRSGGEYVYISRILNPLAGFVANFGAYIAFCFFAATGSYLVFTLALSPLLTTWGVVTHTHGLVSAGQWVGTNGHAWLLGSLLILVSGILVGFGMKVYYRYQALTFWVGVVGLAVLLLVLLVTSRTGFVHGFNRFMTGVGSHDTYASVLAKARAASLPTNHSLYDTLGLFTIATAVAGTGYIGGEVRSPGRTQRLGMLGATSVYYVLLMVMGVLISKTVGLGFNHAASFLAIQEPTKWTAGVSPVLPFYAFLGTTSPFLLVVMALGMVLFTAILVPQQIIFPTRMLFAWSFDRLIPDKVAEVEPRTHSPIIATTLATLTVEALLALYGAKQITYINPVLIIAVVYILLSIAAIVFPYRRSLRGTYVKSPADVNVAGVPLLTVFGVISLAFWAVTLYIALSADALGANTTSNIRIAVITFVVPLVYYIGIWYYRMRQGINLRATFAELPPA
jgi:APA family basic amino acid/polyamine antiporter